MSEAHESEIDCLHPRKKRRLRLQLVTSKLSNPYATPPTFIPVNKPLRNGVWARQRNVGRDLIRKAAIFNSLALKWRASGLRDVDHRYLTYKASLIESCPAQSRSISRSQSPQRKKLPDGGDPVSEDYDAFHAFDPFYASDDDESANDGAVYSDFNVLRNAEGESDVDDCEEEYSFDSLNLVSAIHMADGGQAMQLLIELERSAEVSYAPGIS